MAAETLTRETTHRQVDPVTAPPVPLPPSPPSPLPPSPEQHAWAHSPLASRLTILKRARHELAALTSQVTAAISPYLARSGADTLVSELLPLLDAIHFLERESPHLLRPRRLGRRGLPFWLSGVDAAVHRVPLGRILIIGPSNYPLFLPGVQAFQALAAGNSVIWKPGLGGAPVAHLVSETLFRAGLPRDLLQVTADTVEAAQAVLNRGVDKVFFTGSGTTARHLLRQLAETATPCVCELSGNDAAIVLPSADLDRVIPALVFGVRLNGSATCMAPRRILLADFPVSRRKQFVDRLQHALSEIPAVALSPSTRRELTSLLTEAEQAGATVIGDPAAEAVKPILVLNGSAPMRIAQSDIFAPVLTLIEVQGSAGILDAQAACPLALTTSIFGNRRDALRLARQIETGVVTVNDLIVPTADPRIPFGGRRQSGFGSTRGAEGLLEMTAVKAVSTRRSRSTRHFEPTGKAHQALFAGIIEAAHAARSSKRWRGLKRAITAAMELKKK